TQQDRLFASGASRKLAGQQLGLVIFSFQEPLSMKGNGADRSRCAGEKSEGPLDEKLGQDRGELRPVLVFETMNGAGQRSLVGKGSKGAAERGRATFASRTKLSRKIARLRAPAAVGRGQRFHLQIAPVAEKTMDVKDASARRARGRKEDIQKRAESRLDAASDQKRPFRFISVGCGNPMTLRSVGAMSASIPARRLCPRRSG